MADRTFTDEELIAAHNLAFDTGTDEERLLDAREILLLGPWRENGDAGERRFALALGVLPDGWRHLDALGDSFEYALESGADAFAGRAYRGRSLDLPRVEFRDWPEAVRSGQADIANRLIAAHVELERRRSEKGGAV